MGKKKNLPSKSQPYSYPGWTEEEGWRELNIAHRKNLTYKAEASNNTQNLINSVCADSFLYWVNSFGWTMNPRLNDPHLPFITFKFQDQVALDIIECIEQGKDIHIDKSRDMGVSWLVLAIFTWGWLYRGWDLRVGSRTRDYVDKGGDMSSLFEKIRYMLQRLPEWMIPPGFNMKRGTSTNAAARLLHPVNGNTIIGEATSPNFARGGRSKAILYDEFAFWECAEEAWKGGADTTNCRILVSTPDGLGNKFADVKFDEGLEIVRKTLHWTSHPDKDEKWYKNEQKRRTDTEMAQEVDISYESSSSNKVYEQFSEVPIGEDNSYEYDPYLPLFCFWDFGEGGQDPTAIIWAQENPATGYVRIIDNYATAHGDINYAASVVTGVMNSEFTYDTEALVLMERQAEWKAAVHTGDPYSGIKKTFVGQTTIEKELNKNGIHINLNRGVNSVVERIRITKILMPRLKVHRRCTGKKGFWEAIMNSRYPKKKRVGDSTASNTKPVHNEFSHYRTALEYGAEYLEGYASAKKKRRRKDRDNKPRNTGYKDRFKNALR